MRIKQAKADDDLQEVKNTIESQSQQFLTKEEAAFISNYIKVIKVKKGEFLLRERQIAKNCYYIYKGCVREFFLKDGEEITTEFYTVGDAITDDLSKLNNVPSKVNWECSVDCIFSVVPGEIEREMYKRFPRLEALCRIEAEKKLGGYKQALSTYLVATPEERYENLRQTRPDLLELVPQYHIASYLGVKPESLSRIRKKLLTRG